MPKSLMPKRLIKVFGMERTCTNYVVKLLEFNFDNYELANDELGWKHGPPKDPRLGYVSKLRNVGVGVSQETLQAIKDERLHYIVCIKNPYAWLLSYFKGLAVGHVLPQHYVLNDDPMKEHITETRDYLHKFNDPEFIKACCNKYNRMYGAWSYLKDNDFFDFTPFSVVNIRHEDLLNDFAITLNNIEYKCFLNKKVEKYVNTEHEVLTDAVLFAKKFRKKYYDEKKYMKLLTETQKSILDEYIDWEFFEERFGYRKVCGATTNMKGETHCSQEPLEGKLRCRLHGGLSPKTTGYVDKCVQENYG